MNKSDISTNMHCALPDKAVEYGTHGLTLSERKRIASRIEGENKRGRTMIRIFRCIFVFASAIALIVDCIKK